MIASISQRKCLTLTKITAREKQVLDQISFGLTTKEIASNLYVSAHTIISHRKNLLIKMESRNVAGMIRRAFEIGLLSIHQEMQL